MTIDRLKQLNKKLQKILTKEKFMDRIEVLVKEGSVEIVDNVPELAVKAALNKNH